MAERLKIYHKNSFKKSCGSRDQKQLMKIGALLQHTVTAPEQAVPECKYYSERWTGPRFEGPIINNVLKTHILYTKKNVQTTLQLRLEIYKLFFPISALLLKPSLFK